MDQHRLSGSLLNSAPLRWGLVGLAALLLYFWLQQQGLVELISDGGDRLLVTLRELGWLGPVALVLLITVAVVLSPLPSAPIALAAGALYGHGWGTLYVELGSLLGAVVAFGISRYLCPQRMRLWLERTISFKRYNSQYALMLAVAVSRLLPFVSFDLVSYAAGLTPLAWWRFILATMVGILPASFLLAHLGSEMASFDIERIALAILVLVVLGAAPLVVQYLRNSNH